MGKTDTRSTSAEKFNLEATEQLINKVCANFANQMEAKFSAKFDLLNEKLSELSQTLITLDNTVSSNKSNIQIVKKKCEDTEQYLKRNCLRVNGIPEQEKENILQVMLEFINTKLKVTCVNSDVDAVFRAGKVANTRKPRSIIISFVSNVKRNEVFYSKKFLKDSGVFIFEDLTKLRFGLLNSAKAKYGKSNAWSANGKIYVIDNNEKRIVNSEDDL